MEKTNIIKVSATHFFVNRSNPRLVSYGFVSEAEWRPMALNTYAMAPPPPTQQQIMYILEGDPYKAAYTAA